MINCQENKTFRNPEDAKVIFLILIHLKNPNFFLTCIEGIVTRFHRFVNAVINKKKYFNIPHILFNS